jgi:hypothetical protein
MGYARIRVSFDLLRDALHLPRLAEIKLVAMPSDPCDPYRLEEAEILVAHPDLSDVLAPDELPPLITPTFRRQEPVVFVDWGQK